MAACARGNRPVVELLLDLGCQAMIKDEREWSALEHACGACNKFHIFWFVLQEGIFDYFVFFFTKEAPAASGSCYDSWGVTACKLSQFGDLEGEDSQGFNNFVRMHLEIARGWLVLVKVEAHSSAHNTGA
jgi:hypothetical protein